MSEKEIDDKLKNGVCAPTITILQWTRAKTIIGQFELNTYRKFVNFIIKYDIDFVCPMCFLYDCCDECLIKKESGKHCLEKNSMYKNITKSKTQKELIESINILIEFLKRFEQWKEV